MFDSVRIEGAGSGVFAKVHGIALSGSTVVGHFKISTTEPARAAVRHEVATLVEIAAQDPGLAPAVLCAGGGSLAAWSVCENVTGRACPLLGPADVSRLAARVGGLRLPTPTYPVPAVLALRRGGGEAPCHGDMARFNAFDSGGRRGLVLIDWEWACPNGLGGFDAAHYFLAGALTGRGAARGRVVAGALLARSALRRSVPFPVETLKAYLGGMSDFYADCARQAGDDPSKDAVVMNAARVQAVLASWR